MTDMNNSPEFILSLFDCISKLKSIRRTGWVESSVRDPESIADHSFGVVFLAAVLADLRGLDVAEVVRMAILHDLPEAVTGDLTPREKQTKIKEVEKIEEEAIRRLFKDAPREVYEKYVSAWRKFSENSTPEARLVKLVDKLEMGLQACKYMEERLDSRLIEIYDSAKNYLEEDRELLEVLKRMLKR
ncbi:MAG: HD domain-containing protein [Nitrososphaerota archaeon]